MKLFFTNFVGHWIGNITCKNWHLHHPVIFMEPSDFSERSSLDTEVHMIAIPQTVPLGRVCLDQPKTRYLKLNLFKTIPVSNIMIKPNK